MLVKKVLSICLCLVMGVDVRSRFGVLCGGFGGVLS